MLPRFLAALLKPSKGVLAYQTEVAAIGELEGSLASLDDAGLKNLADLLKERVRKGEAGKHIRIEAFALVREASRRILGRRHYDVQLMGGIALDEGRIAEMRTGEGKTLVAALPTFLNALQGKGVHVVTVNDYLARRDAEIVGRIHRFLGLSVGIIVPGLSDGERRDAYACDVTYATNSEIGFDYLRDNMRFSADQRVQRGHAFAIVDEVDSILIDEARTPLVISGPAEDRADMYRLIDGIVSRLDDEHAVLDEKSRGVVLSDAGIAAVEQALREHDLLGAGEEMHEARHSRLVHHVDLALRAHRIYRRDREYLVRSGEVIIVDEFTGRTMIGRRFSEGIHQAIEAKEGVDIQPETTTLSSITYQNLFRMYAKLSGMTGTAATEADELREIYGLDVVSIPTNRPIARIDEDDEIYQDEASKYQAVAKAVVEACHRRQPVLIGTSSVEKSEIIASLLQAHGFRRLDWDADGAKGPEDDLAFHVLNARHHEHEAHIIANAGLPGAVTIATNMAGRGTDIQLGGNVEERIEAETAHLPEGIEKAVAAALIEDEVATRRAVAVAAGGLLVIGTDRHESRRIDNQLRGRAGRQGDPGRSRFFISLDDDIARKFSTDKTRQLLAKLGLKPGEAVTHPWISKALERAQSQVEAANFNVRKDLLKYDDVNSEQRKAAYSFRDEIMAATSVIDWIEAMTENVITDIHQRHIPADTYVEQWDILGYEAAISAAFDLELPITAWAAEEGIGQQEIIDCVISAVHGKRIAIGAAVGEEALAHGCKTILLMTFDRLWQEQLAGLEALRSSVGLRSYGQRNPIEEYKIEAYEMFSLMMDRLASEVSMHVSNIRIQQKEAA